MVASYGDNDRQNRGAAARLESWLTELDVAHDVKEYPGAGHAFMAPEPPSSPVLARITGKLGMVPDPAATDDVWARIFSFFAEHLPNA